MARVIKTKLTPADVVYIIQSTENNSTLAAQFNVTRQAISLIRNGKAWTDIAPEIPRVPIRVKESIRREYIANANHCTNCVEFKHGKCSYGFPEAIDEPTFAAICDFYSRNTADPA
jgi:hypothetical protein